MLSGKFSVLPVTRRLWFYSLRQLLIIFLQIEGVASVLVALIPWFFLDDMPDRSKFLSPEEKAVVMRRLVLDRSNVETEQISIKNLKDLKGNIVQQNFD